MSGNKHTHPRDVTQGSPKKLKPSVSEVAQARMVTRTLLDAVEAIESKSVFHIGIAKLGVGNSRTSASNSGGSKSGGSGSSSSSSTSSITSSSNNNNSSGSNGIGSGNSNGSSSNNNGGSSSSSSSSSSIGAGSSSSNNNNNNSNASDAHAASGHGVQGEGGGLQSPDRQVVQFKTATKLLLSAAEVIDSKPKGGTAALGISNRSSSSSSSSSNSSSVGGAHAVSRQDGRGEGGKNLPRIQQNVDGILRRMVQIGNLPYLDWGDLKVLLAARMLEVVGALEKESGFVQAKGEKDYVQRRYEVVASLRKCDVAPLSVQRLAEILQEPRRHFSSTHKLMNALEKVLRVSGTAHPAVMPAEDEPPSSSLGVNRKPSPGSAIIASIRLGSLKTARPYQVERAVRELREETEEEDGAAMIICGMAGVSAASAISVDAEVGVGSGAGAGTWGRSKSKRGGGGEVCGVSRPNMDAEGKKKRCNGDDGKGSVRPASGDGSSNTSSSGSGRGGGGGSGSGGSISRTKGTRSSSRVRNRSGSSSSSSSSSKRERVGGDDDQVEKAPKKKRKAATKRGARTEQEGDAVVKPKPPPKKVVKKQPAAKEVANKKPSTQKVAEKTPAAKKAVKKEEVAKAEEGESEVVKENQKTETKAAKPPTKRRARRTATLTKKGAAAAAPAAKPRRRK